MLYSNVNLLIYMRVYCLLIEIPGTFRFWSVLKVDHNYSKFIVLTSKYECDASPCVGCKEFYDRSTFNLLFLKCLQLEHIWKFD